MFSTSLKLKQHPCGLRGALADLQEAVRLQPAHPKLRIALFQLLAVLGLWQRALGQLQVIARLDPQLTPLAQSYRLALRAELARAAVFAGTRTPQMLELPDAWTANLAEAFSRERQGQAQLAQALRRSALEQAPSIRGSAGERAFEWICDGDGRLGPVLEAVLEGQYYWIPLDRITRIGIDAPADLRDLVWAPARLTLRNGGEAAALLPVRYPGPADDDRLALAQRTEWDEIGPESYRGRGQKMWITDRDQFALLEARSIRFDC